MRSTWPSINSDLHWTKTQTWHLAENVPIRMFYSGGKRKVVPSAGSAAKDQHCHETRQRKLLERWRRDRKRGIKKNVSWHINNLGFKYENALIHLDGGDLQEVFFSSRQTYRKEEQKKKNVRCSRLRKFFHPSWCRWIKSINQFPLSYTPPRERWRREKKKQQQFYRNMFGLLFSPSGGTVGKSYETQQWSAACHRAAPGNRRCPSHQVGNLEPQRLMAQKQREQSAFNKCNSSFTQPASKVCPPPFVLFVWRCLLSTDLLPDGYIK